MKSRKFIIAYWLLLVFIFLESYTFFHLRSLDTNIYLKPSLFLLCTLAICSLSGWLLYHQAKVSLPKFRPWSTQTKQVVLWSFLASVIIFTGFQFNWLFKTYEVAPDIVPAMQMYVGRLLSGDPVYAPMAFETWTVYPNYLPLMWLPYIVPELLNFDYRMWAVGLLVIAILFWAFRLIRTDAPAVMTAFHLFFPFAILLFLIKNVPNDLAFNVEFTPIAFYFFLVLAVLSGGWLSIGATTLLCLLSRLAFSFWLPAYLIILWIENKFAKPFKIGMLCLVGIIFIYIVPFVLKDPESFERGMNYYGTVSQEIWTQPWHARDGRPIVLQEGTSFAVYFYDNLAGEPLDRLALAKRFHFGIALLAAFLFFGVYWLLRKKIDYRLLSIIGLKFYLSIFYLFLHTPFAYLYLLPIFLSFPMLWMLQLSFFKKLA
ncbi:MAG: hypothetical protein Sapg2KO_01040 [Saprospiraceae bacterium]